MAEVCLHIWLRKTVYDNADGIHSLSFLYTIEKLFQGVVYRKNIASAKKIQAAKMFGKSHSSIKAIAKVLHVEIPTAEVYILDAYCAGAPISIEKLANELNVCSPLSDRISQLIMDGIPTLRQLKDDALDGQASYNQIKVVLAAIIRDELDKILYSRYVNGFENKLLF